MRQSKLTKTWERTRLQNLIRHKSGRYYARAFADGKEVWKSLKTSHFSVAEAKLAEFLKQHRERRSNRNGEVSAKMTFGEAAVTHLRNLDADLKRANIRGKEITLPATDKFNALIAEMRAAHSRDSQNCADLAEGLAFTGCRKGEASEIEFRDLDFDAGELVVRGDAVTGTKNWEVRRVPLIPDARTLFQRMRRERLAESLDAKVFR